MEDSLYLLLGRARTLILRTLHQAARDGTPLYLREIARQTELSPTAVQYELRLLRQLGMLENVGTAARPLYVLNREHGLFSDMHAMFTRPPDTELVPDDAHFARKRERQREDLASGGPDDNSPFLRQRGSLRQRVKVG